MTKGTGQKHHQREDHAHAAHQADAARQDDHDIAQKAKPIEKGRTERGGHPVEGHPKRLGAFLLGPTVGQVLRPAAKAVIKGGMLAYQGLSELCEAASDLVVEARAELEQQPDAEVPPSPPPGPRSRPARDSLR